MKTSRYVLYAGVVAALLVAALIVGLGLRDRTVQVAATPSPIAATSTPIPASSPPATPSPAATASAAQTQTPQLGAITGRFSYPSDFIPALTVYAISVADPRVFFSVDFAGFGSPPRPTLPPGVSQATYTLSGIAPGTYHVIAYRNDGGDFLGVYSRNTVNCIQTTTGGQNSTPAPGCSANDHTLVPVTVRAGEIVMRIDITDWVQQSQGTYPARPR